jgi:hypothetical protein
MPINFDLEEIRKEYNCNNYFETGLWDPRDEVSSKKALSCGFEKVICIEIRSDWVELGFQIFNKEIMEGRYCLIMDDSVNMKKYFNKDVLQNRTIFFLDAHVDNLNIKNYKFKCPLFEELEAIKSIERKDNIILIDDLRMIIQPFPWGEDKYGNINFLDKIIEKILEINSNYKFKTLDGFIKDDVLMAYI